MNKEVILALDVGSSSIRVIAYGLNDCTTVLESVSKQRKSVISGGKINVLNLFEDIDTCIDDILSKINIRNNNDLTICAVGFSSFVMNLIGVDEHGTVIGEDATMSYACQSDNVNVEVERLKAELGEEKLKEMYQQTGAPIHPAYAVAQMRVFYREGKCDCHVKQWQTIASICISRWTGRNSVPVSFSEASWTGLLNFRTCQYDEQILKLLPSDCCDALPPLADYYVSINDDSSNTAWKICEKIHGVDSNINPYYVRWPALRDAKLLLGIGDGACANIGSKCCSINRIACTVGTSAAARVCLPLPIMNYDDECYTTTISVEPGLFCYRINSNYVVVGGALTDGGSVVEWLSKLLKLPMGSENFQKCLEEAEDLLKEDYTAKCSSSPTVVPFLSGERSTGFRTGATGAIFGLTRDTSQAALLKGSLEGVTLRINAIVRLIEDVIASLIMKNSNESNQCRNQRIVCSGEALEVNSLWRRMVADSTGLDVVLDETTQQGTSRGVAILVRMAVLGQIHFEGEEIIETGETIITPVQESKEYWDETFVVQERLINVLTPLYRR